MWCLILSVCVLTQSAHSLWDANPNCPIFCTCRLEHLTETAIYRFMQANKTVQYHSEVNSAENNDVLDDDNLETEIFQDKPIVRSATCILYDTLNTSEVLEQIPKEIETLTLIQGYASGNKTVKFSDLKPFRQLISLEVLGPNIQKHNNSNLVCEIDESLPDIKYLNFERVRLNLSKAQIQTFVKEIEENGLNFEYVQKFENNAHALTFLREGEGDEVLEFNKFKERGRNGHVPLFIGFKNLFLLRISGCDLNNLHWEMFDGLTHLEYLLLEKNNIRFIPAFAFYGTPNLKTLSLAHNHLLDIQITDLAGLLELEYLDLSYNNFTQLSELSLPPFPKLKLANFANNPVSVVFPNTFEVMNTTNSLIIGSDDMPLTLITNSLLGLDGLGTLTLNNLDLKLLKRDLLVGMPNIKELIITGRVEEIQYDAFLEVTTLNKLIISHCKIQNLSMDSFIGLGHLHYLDLSKNLLEYLPPGVFDHLTHIKELYLNQNLFKELPRDIFARIHPKLLRLTENPWQCSCAMSEWKPVIVNKKKQRVIKSCNQAFDKGIGCTPENTHFYKYIYDNKMAPKCHGPKQYENWSVFQVMRRLLRCPDYKPKFRKHHLNKKNSTSSQVQIKFNATTNEQSTTSKYEKYLKKVAQHAALNKKNDEDNSLNPMLPFNSNEDPFVKNTFITKTKFRKFRKPNSKL